MYISVVVVLITLVLSAFFSGMEIAFLNKNRLRLEIDRKQSRMFDYIAGIFSRHQGEYITTILVGNNIALVIYSMCLSLVLREIARLIGWTSVQEGSILLETIIPTIIIIFLGEYLPKSVFRSNPNFYYRYLTPVMYFFYILLYPITRATTLLSYGMLRLCGRKTSGVERQIEFDRSDLESLLENNNSTESTTESDNDIKMFQNALDFADLRVRDAMVSRIDVEAVDVEDCSMEELTAKFVETMYSRIFVWRDSIDNIIGYVNSKSLFENPKSIEEALMKVDYVAETLPLQDLLTQFTKNKSSIAVVIDEFGGTAGIISLEDVLEQIFGEIEDEHDKQEMVEKRISEHEFVFSCRLEVEYINEKYGLDIVESDEYDTLAGYIISRYEELPAAGTVMEFDGLRIKILRTTRSRIELAKVERIEKK
ncbi:MAG: HlyC/CorC family transporter [Rikenellaceae bacterium]|nr:HlyC/CorC family transporter [Rikenellaceae bacterium]